MIPPTPPREVLEAVAAALLAAQDLDDQGRALRFDLDPDRRLRILMVDAEDRVLEEVSPSRVIEIASGPPALNPARAAPITGPCDPTSRPRRPLR